MADVTIENIDVFDIRSSSKYFIYSLFAALAGIVGIVILIGLVIWISQNFGGVIKIIRQKK